MPIAAIPPGIELRKISATQKKAVDELIKKQQDSTLWNSAIPSTVALLIAAGAGGIYLFRDEIKEWAKNQADDLWAAITGKIVGAVVGSGGVVADLLTTVIGRDEPRTPEYTESGAGPIPRCLRWESDYVNTIQQVQEGGSVTALALAQSNIIKNMKAEKCSRPSSIPQKQWDKV